MSHLPHSFKTGLRRLGALISPNQPPMKTHHHHNNHNQPPPRLKPIFSCAFFRHCTQPSHSPTTPPSPPHPPPSQKPSSSSSSSASHSFTQWRFPPTNTPPPQQQQQQTQVFPSWIGSRQTTNMPAPDIREIINYADVSFRKGTDPERSAALHALEHALVPNPPSDTDPVVPGSVMDGVLGYIANGMSVKAGTKLLLAMCLAEHNRRVAVEHGAVGKAVEALGELDDGSAERALAALELMCTVPEGAKEAREHALAVPVLVAAMGRLEGRGREYAIGVLTVVFGGEEGLSVGDAPPEEVARAVALAMGGECSARGRRKGEQLLKVLEKVRNERLDLIQDGNS